MPRDEQQEHVTAQQALSGSAARAEPEPRRTQHFALNSSGVASRAGSGTTTPLRATTPIDADSPDRLLFDPEAISAWYEEEATRTEDTADETERHERMGYRLGGLPGAQASAVEFVVRVDQLV